MVSAQAPDGVVAILVLVNGAVGLLTAGWFYSQLARIKVEANYETQSSSAKSQLLGPGKHSANGQDDEEFHADVFGISNAIAEGR